MNIFSTLVMCKRESCRVMFLGSLAILEPVRQEQLKSEQQEKAVANQLIKTLRYSATYLGRGAAGIQPDELYSIKGFGTVGIECTTAYYEQRHAESEWRFITGKISPDPSGVTSTYKSYQKDDGSPVFESADKMLLKRVQERLDEKCSKQYRQVDEAWLCIPVQHCWCEIWEMDRLVRSLSVPPEHGFKRIYVGFYTAIHEGSTFRAYEVLSGKVEMRKLRPMLRRLILDLAFRWWRLRSRLARLIGAKGE